MGTQIQYKSSFPGYSLMRNLNEDADRGGWPAYHGDKMLMSNKNYTGFLPRPGIDGNSEYDKESLRRTMLMHEATFKNQVAELHRLYKTQRELMEELKAKEANNASQTMFHPSSSQTAFVDTGKMCYNSGKSSCSGPSFSGTDNLVSPTKLVKNSTLQCHAIPNGSFTDNRILDPNSNKRKMIDLQLPADQYVDDEDRRRFEQEKVFTVANGFRSTSGSNPVDFRKFQDGGHTKGFERMSENCGTEMSKRCERPANKSILSSGLVPSTQTTYPTVPAPTGFGSSSSFSSWINPTSNFPPSSVGVQALNCSNSSVQFSKISEMTTKKNMLAEPQWHLHGHPNTSFTNGVSYPNGVLHRPQSESSRSEKCFPSVGFGYLGRSCTNESTSLHFENNGTRKHFKDSKCMDVKPSKDLNLNEAIPNGSMEGRVPLQENMILDRNGKSKDQMGGLPWLKVKPDTRDVTANGSGVLLSAKGFCLSQGYPHQFSQKVGTAPNFIQDSSSTSIGCSSEDARNQKSDSITATKILGVPIFDNTHTSKDSWFCSSSKSVHKQSDAEGISNDEKVGVGATYDQSLPAVGQMLSSDTVAATTELDKGLSGVKYRFNLNACADEEETELDLESPADRETSEVISAEEEYQLNQHVISSQSSQTESQDSLEKLTKSVAEAIVMISASDFCFPLEDGNNNPSETAVSTLHWFANIASNHTGLSGNNEGISTENASNDDNESSSDSDYFEKMTLKLTENKADAYLCKPGAADLPNEEEVRSSSLLTTRRRRGQAKRGRKRDFQKDVLPGIASLSRQEVAEDIQAIGGLMRAIGQTWHTGLTRRNCTKNGWGRGRRRTRNGALPVAEILAYSPPRQQANTGELGLEERSLTGWGKTTRRPRRQRFATGNISIPITQA